MAPPSPLYLQVAAHIRERILSGRLRPGAHVPSERDLMGEHEISRGTARQALALLRDEGLIEAHRGHPHRVREPDEPRQVPIQRGSRLAVRMPTAAEREELGIGPGVPVLAVQHGARRALYAGDRHVFTVA